MDRPALERRLTPCAEFPNDNHELHHGATWICLELGRELACERPPSPLPVPGQPADEIVCSRATGAAPHRPPHEPADGIVSLRAMGAAPHHPPHEPADGIVRLRTTEVPDAERENGPLPAGLGWHGPGASLGARDADDDPLGDDEEPIEIVDELAFDDAVDDLPSEPCVDPAGELSPVDPFAQLVQTLGEVARAGGGGAEAVACLEALFGQTRFEGVAPGERAAEALVAGGMIARSARGFTRSSSFGARVIAWQGILRGESEDFSRADGGALEPLDEWAADLLARIVGPPARADGIRRDLRRRGVAAFGLVAEAA
jgi:hypothetical protein